jgi:hypothetical protein
MDQGLTFPQSLLFMTQERRTHAGVIDNITSRFAISDNSEKEYTRLR